MTSIRVVAAVVDTRQLTLYKDDGKTVLIPQGDPRLRKILDEITPIISQPGGIATIDVSEINVYRDFEEQTGGFARFFRVARKKVAGFFGASEQDDIAAPVAPTQVGTLPAQLLSSAIDDIMANAVPATRDDFGEVGSEETVVAVVGSGKEAKVVPGMENLKDQFAHASRMGSTRGVQNFLRRISAVIDQRQHSIHDLLRFMERGDLPIADDGSIIIYKILKRRGEYFVDCHSGRVNQRVGSFVCMDPSMVDHNRRNECSNGLHVARRGYLGQFGGDVCVLAKVAPEDVIAVPNYDANKMRVCGYHIIFELDDESFRKLKNNKPMTDNPKAQTLLGRAISGDHIRRTEEVRITEGYGGGVIVTPLGSKGERLSRTKGPAPKATALDDANTAPSVDPKTVAKTVVETKSRAKKPALSSRQQTARTLYDNGDIQELMAFKKKSKVSWSSLGISEEEQQHILTVAANPVPKPAPRPATKQAPTVKAPPKKAAPVKPAVGRPSDANGGSRKARMFELEKIYSDPKADNRHRGAAAAELILLRQQSKKSWAALGYPKLTDQLLRDFIDRAAKADAEAKKATPPKPKHTCKPKSAPMTGGPSQQAARKLFNSKDWKGLVRFKQSKKKSWKALGFTSKEESEIKLHIGG